jgi:hypothetical protein
MNSLCDEGQDPSFVAKVSERVSEICVRDDPSPSEASIVANFVDSLLEQQIAGIAEVAFADTRGVWC